MRSVVMGQYSLEELATGGWGTLIRSNGAILGGATRSPRDMATGH